MNEEGTFQHRLREAVKLWGLKYISVQTQVVGHSLNTRIIEIKGPSENLEEARDYVKDVVTQFYPEVEFRYVLKEDKGELDYLFP